MEETGMEALLSSLNDRQKEAALCIDEHVRIVAGAGSGKTRVLMARIEYLLNEIGVYPDRILAITFTNKAAAEMKERLRAQVPDLADQVRISTIHALCVRILREDAAAAGYPKSFAILDGDDQKTILRRIYKTRGIQARDIPAAEALAAISSWKRVGISPSAVKASWRNDQLKSLIYQDYEKELNTMKAMDFDDLLIQTEALLAKNEEVRTKWQNRLDYLHVDEFQDVDPIQYSIIRRLVRPDAVLAVVGDPDQTIYTWRGASVDIILNFERDFQPSKTIILSQNYRSSAPILNASNALIANNRNRVKKDLFTEEEGTDPIELIEGADEDAEAMKVVSRLRELHKSGLAWKDMAILYRSNYLSRPFEKILLLYNLPYRIFGGIRFYERAEIKDMLSYLRLLEEPDEEDPKQMALNLAFERVINTPRRAMGPKFLEDLRTEAQLRGVNLLQGADHPQTMKAAAAKKAQKFYDLIQSLKDDLQQAIQSGTLSEIIDCILEKTGYKKMLEDQKEEGQIRLDNVLELKKDLETATAENPNLRLEDYLQNIALLSERGNDNDGDSITLMTVHAAKGTEYPAVFVAGVNENVFPSNRAINESGNEGLEEERRLMYVAMTRAEKTLGISWNRGYSFHTSGSRTPSRFLAELPDEYTDRPKRLSAHSESAAASERSNTSSMSLAERRRKTAQARKKQGKMTPGTAVDHKKFGEGIILSLSAGIAEVAFQSPFGTKKIKTDYLQPKER